MGEDLPGVGLGQTVRLPMHLMDIKLLRAVQALEGLEAIHRHTRSAGDKGEEEGLVLGVEGLEDLGKWVGGWVG